MNPQCIDQSSLVLDPVIRNMPMVTRATPIVRIPTKKSQFSLYVYSKTKKSDELPYKLGKYKMGKVRVYAKN